MATEVAITAMTAAAAASGATSRDQRGRCGDVSGVLRCDAWESRSGGAEPAGIVSAAACAAARSRSSIKFISVLTYQAGERGQRADVVDLTVPWLIPIERAISGSARSRKNRSTR